MGSTQGLYDTGSGLIGSAREVKISTAPGPAEETRPADENSIASQVSITAIHDLEKAESAVSTETNRTLDDVRCRAYDYFERRGALLGRDWEDWLRAERELLWRPPAEMFENAFTIVLRVAVPGFDPSSIQVTATPHVLVVQATETHQHFGLETRLRFCEFGQQLFRRFELPARTDPATASATLDKGILQIVTNIARQPQGEPADKASANAAS